MSKSQFTRPGNSGGPTRRQKDISRLVRERRQNLKSKLERGKRQQEWQKKGSGSSF